MVHRSCRRCQRGEQSLPQWNVRRSRRCRGETRTLHPHETEDDKPSSHDLSPLLAALSGTHRCGRQSWGTDCGDFYEGPMVLISIVGVSVISASADENSFFSNACDN